MKLEKIVLEIHDKARNSVETVPLELIDGAYRTKIEDIKEAYKYMLPGDTITIVYAIFDEIKDCVASFEVDYTFPESRLHTENAVYEKGTAFDRIETYHTETMFDNKIQKIGYQQLYEDVKNRKMTTFRHNTKKYTVLVAEMYFYSNYILRQPNIAKKNIITINSDNKGFQP